MVTPVPYAPSVEHIDEDEAKVTQDLVDALLGISKKTFKDGGHGLRSVHAKSHAILNGKLNVLPNAPEYAQGLFAEPGTFDIVMRFSSTPGDVLPDSVSTPRGLAIKVLDVAGPDRPGVDGSKDQDFVMVNGPKFQAPNAKAFLANLKLLAGTTDRIEGVKIAASAALQATEKAIETVGGKSSTLKALGGEPATHPLGETFFAQLPMRFGEYIAKMSVVPVAPELTALKGHHVDIDKDPVALRKAMISYFAFNGGVWEVRAQLCTDIDKMPVEDAQAVWSEDESPYVTVARIMVPPQEAWTDEKSIAVDDHMSFSPWHCLQAHHPLGSIMRVRKQAYEASRKFRMAHANAVVASDEAQ